MQLHLVAPRAVAAGVFRVLHGRRLEGVDDKLGSGDEDMDVVDGPHSFDDDDDDQKSGNDEGDFWLDSVDNEGLWLSSSGSEDNEDVSWLGSESEDWNFGGTSGGFLFSALTSSFSGENSDMDEFMAKVEECGIDSLDMSSKMLGALLNEPSPGSSSYESYMSIFQALKDDDEGECTAANLVDIESASQDYLDCSGTTRLSAIIVIAIDNDNCCEWHSSTY